MVGKNSKISWYYGCQLKIYLYNGICYVFKLSAYFEGKYHTE